MDKTKKKRSALKKYVTNAVGKIISLPKVAVEKRKADQANEDADLIKKARSYGDMPGWIQGQRTEAVEARSVAEDAKERTKKRKPSTASLIGH